MGRMQTMVRMVAGDQPILYGAGPPEDGPADRVSLIVGLTLE
jgi:hypothetical protein